MFSSIRTAIVDKLKESEALAFVYRTPRAKVDGFPVAVVSMPRRPREAEYNSTGSKDRLTLVFHVLVYYPLTTEDAREAEEVALEETMDEVLELFAERQALAPACDWVEPVSVDFDEVTVGEGTFLQAELIVRCVKFTG